MEGRNEARSRLAGRPGAGPGIRALLISAGVMASYLLFAAVLGLPLLAPEAGPPLRVDAGAWTAAVMSLLFGYVAYLLHRVVTDNADDLESLQSISAGPTATGLRRRWILAVDGSGPAARRWVAAGAVCGVGIWSVTAARAAAQTSWGETLLSSAWFLVASPTLLGRLAHALFVTVLGVRVLSATARRDLEPDPVDPTGLAPFARIGLRNALGWLIASTLASLLFLNIPVRALDTLLVVLGVVLGVATIALALPLRDARNAARRAKREALARIDAAIRGDLARTLAREADSAASASRLAGLVAYRGLVRSARESALDTHVARRFLLYLTIPVVGWVGGALVERLLDAWLG